MTVISLLALLIATLSFVKADLAVYCVLNADPGKFKRFADFKFYEGCDTACACSAHELLCIERHGNEQSSIRLEATSYEYAESCMQSNRCICNIDEAAWA